ncbi:MAG: PEGA domain-containing protein [Cellvibrionaceae bacterium]
MSTSGRSPRQEAGQKLEATDPGLTAGPRHGEPIEPSAFEPLKQPLKARGRRPRPVHFLLGGSFLVLALLIAFLFSAKSVFIQVEPPETELAIDGGFHLPLGQGYLMLTGDYQLNLAAPGYYPAQRTITVDQAQNQNFRFSLDKLPGRLSVTANMEEPGQVWIDGVERGTLDETISDIAPGEHDLRIVTERYQPFTRTITIAGLDRHQTLAVELEPAWAEVKFATTPPGAQLMVDEQVIGTTPVTAEILAGERTVSLKLGGYKAWQDLLRVDAGQVIDVPMIELEKADGLVLVQSRPAQASITVDGDYQGLTPREVALPPGKSYQITLFKDGFKPAQRKVAVESGREQSISVDLEANLGQIKVTSAPGDALLYVNGRLMGRANQTLTLPAHQATIEVRKEGYANFQTTVLPRPSLDQSIDIRLKTLEEAKWENIESTITSKAGQKLKLFKPEATFTMGSSRREQGRRANESLRDVALSRPFYLGTHEVTNRQFRQFDEQHSSSHAKGESLDSEDYPVVNVSWQRAALYCNWLSEQEGLPLFYELEEGVVSGVNPQATGYRLPTEAEWAWAARYQDGEMLKYAWGPELQPSANSANFADRSAAQLVGYVQPGYDDGYPASAPVGSFPANAKGLYDLDGNVAEWVNDYYEIAVSLSQTAEQDPLGPATGSYRVIRGSSWAHGSVTELRLSFRDYGEEARNYVGFRVARFVE